MRTLFLVSKVCFPFLHLLSVWRSGFSEGLTIHTVSYEDQGRKRPILYRAALSEMVVPYGDPGPTHTRKNAFDSGEYGIGQLANSLELGLDISLHGEQAYNEGAASLGRDGMPTLKGMA
jgi:primary-amine oxidase